MDNIFELTSVCKSDASALAAWFNSPQISRYMDDSEPDKVYTERDIYSMIDEPGESLYFAFRASGQTIGYASIYNIEKTKSRAEISFLIGSDTYRGKGLGSLLVELICKKARENEILDLYCSIYSGNTPSIKSVEKSGFIKTGEIGLVSEFDNSRMCEYHYAKKLI